MRARELRHPLFLGLAALYVLTRALRLGGVAALPAVLNSYLADFACLPLELTVALALLRHVYFRRPDFRLPPTWIFSAWLVTAGWFELCLPRLSAAATADPLDVVAYGLGALLFAHYLNR